MNKIEFDMACYIQAAWELEDGPLKRFLIMFMANHFMNFDEAYRLMKPHKAEVNGPISGVVTTPSEYYAKHKDEIVTALKRLEEEE